MIWLINETAEMRRQDGRSVTLKIASAQAMFRQWVSWLTTCSQSRLVLSEEGVAGGNYSTRTLSFDDACVDATSPKEGRLPRVVTATSRLE